MSILDEFRELVVRETNEDFGVSNVVHATECRDWIVRNGGSIVELVNAANALLRYDVCESSDDSYSLDMEVLRGVVAIIQGFKP